MRSRPVWKTRAAVFCAVVLSLFGYAASDAQALIITATGTITDQPYGPDANGLFGSVGASLIGDTYTETIATIPALNAYTTSPSPPYQLSTYGGAAYGAWHSITVHYCGNGQRIDLHANRIESLSKLFFFGEQPNNKSGDSADGFSGSSRSISGVF